MTPKDRVFARLQSKPVDRVPNLNIVMAFAAKMIGASYKDFVQDYRVLTKANIVCCQKYGIDMVSAISDPMREAHDLGATVIFPDDGVPYSPEPLIKEYSNVLRLRIIDPENGTRMLDRIKAIEWYKSNAGSQYPILGWVEGPIAEAADLRGMDNLFVDFFDNEEMVVDLLDICTGQAIAFAEAQVRAGADFIGIGDAAASLIGPNIYKKFVLPRERQIIEAIHKSGAYAKLHICGNITSILDAVPMTGADIIDVDWMVDFGNAVKAFNNKAACGNFDPVAVVLQGNVNGVISSVKKCLSVAEKNTFIAAGCEIPKDTPEDNMHAIAKALED